MFLDVDNFKFINDTLGHATGDHALVILSQLLKRYLCAEHLVARVGGDEFAVLLEDTALEEAQAVAEKLRRAVEEGSFVCEEHGLTLRLSIGLAVIDRPIAPRELLAQADAAMYAAKEHSRTRVLV